MSKLIPFNPYILIGVAVAFAMSNLFSYMKGREHVGVEFTEFRTKVEAENEQLRKHAERVKRESDSASAMATEGWLAAVAYWRDRSHVRVQSNCNSGGVRPVPAVADKPGSTTEELRSDPVKVIAVEQCEERLNNAVLDAAQVEHIRAWISDQRKASIVK